MPDIFPNRVDGHASLYRDVSKAVPLTTQNLDFHVLLVADRGPPKRTTLIGIFHERSRRRYSHATARAATTALPILRTRKCRNGVSLLKVPSEDCDASPRQQAGA
jgi:hypothetical protein